MPNARHTTGLTSVVAIAAALAGGVCVHNVHQSLKPVAARFMPDAKLTPGATLDVSEHQCCQPGYAGKTRNVLDSEKNRVYARYGILNHQPGEYEIDHLISLELGGSNAIENLWPQPYAGTWNAHQKDSLEDRLHKLVCDGTLTLAEAQHAIRTDWIDAYERFISH